MSEVLTAIDAELGRLQARIARLSEAKVLLEEEAQAPPGKGRAVKSTKSTRRKPSQSEGEQRPRKGKAAGPGRGNGQNAGRAAGRKAQALQLLKEGKTPKEVALQLGVSEASIYLYRKHAK